ncbi:MAG: C4-dicarboxylate ABC transporter substrate-binding protein [Rhodospirillaceae bacterium]|nr:C4-dicarboxylate ABC transporter substrate-binding protein [Rhodospirillaceae bacterium]
MLRLLDGVSRAAAWAAAVLFALIGLFVTYEVVLRYVFHAPTTWVEEVSRILQIYGVYLAAAWLVATRQHIRIRLLTGRLPPTGRLWCSRFALLFAAAVGVFAAWNAMSLMQFSLMMQERTDTSLALPMWLVQWPVPAGCALLALHALALVGHSFVDPDRLLATEAAATVSAD